MKIIHADGRIEHAVAMGMDGDVFRPGLDGEFVDAPAPSYFCSFATTEEAETYRLHALKQRDA